MFDHEGFFFLKMLMREAAIFHHEEADARSSLY